jgi:hypothetical protein
MNRFFVTVRFVVTTFMTSMCIHPALAEPEVKYPIALKSSALLRAAGLARDEDDVKPLKNWCYYYGEGGWKLTVSDSFLEKYKSKGFSLHSLCMGLVSQRKFDPETGRRLPSVFFFNEPGLRAALKGRNPKSMDPGKLEQLSEEFASEELALTVPDCFKNGTPYSDCTWRFDVESGARLDELETLRFKSLGQKIERAMANENAINTICGDIVRPDCIRETKGDFPYNNAIHPEHGGLDFSFLNDEILGLDQLSQDDCDSSHGSFVDISHAFPKGFGYALFADGSLGPSASTTTILAAHDSMKIGRQISPKTIDRLMSGR